MNQKNWLGEYEGIADVSATSFRGTGFNFFLVRAGSCYAFAGDSPDYTEWSLEEAKDFYNWLGEAIKESEQIGSWSQ